MNEQLVPRPSKTVSSERVWEIVRTIYAMGEWRETKEGFQFWSDVVADLQALASQIHTSDETSGSLLRPASTQAPPGCHCQTYCAAPVVMGRQMPCRDPEKAARLALNGNPR